MALRVKPLPTQFQPSSLYTPMDSTPLHSLSGVRAATLYRSESSNMLLFFSAGIGESVHSKRR